MDYVPIYDYLQWDSEKGNGSGNLSCSLNNVGITWLLDSFRVAGELEFDIYYYKIR